MPGFLSGDSLKLFFGVSPFILLSLGDFFFAHRLTAIEDVLILASAVYPLGVHVTVSAAFARLTK